jgi:hypothetical protein
MIIISSSKETISKMGLRRIALKMLPAPIPIRQALLKHRKNEIRPRSDGPLGALLTSPLEVAMI